MENKIVLAREASPTIAEKPIETLHLTTFPAYTHSSLNSSVNSLSDVTANPVDSGIESSNSCSSNENHIGPFLCAIFNRLDHMLSNSLQINFILTGLMAKLAYYPHLLLRSFLLNHNIVVQANIKTLPQVRFHTTLVFFYFSIL